MTTRLEERAKKLEASLRQTKARISKEKQQERNGQLVSIGILFEQNFSKMTPDEKAKWKTSADSLDARNKSRVLAAFQRMAQAEISPGAAVVTGTVTAVQGEISPGEPEFLLLAAGNTDRGERP